jgi:hypothetical protein
MHTDDMNDLVLMGLARDSAEAEAKQLRETVAALEARIAKADTFSELFRAWRHSDSVSDRVPLMARVISAERAYREGSDT